MQLVHPYYKSFSHFSPDLVYNQIRKAPPKIEPNIKKAVRVSIIPPYFKILLPIRENIIVKIVPAIIKLQFVLLSIFAYIGVNPPSTMAAKVSLARS